MIVREGKSVFKGVAIGSIFVYRKAEKAVNKVEIEDTAAELARFQAAKEKAMGQLKGLYEKARVDVGEEEAMIFDVHQMLLDDLDYNESITGIIENDRMNAEYAVCMTGEQMAAMFLSMDDDYMRGRAADIHDISDRLISILNGTQVSPEAMPEPVIILAEDLAPSETVQFDKSKLLAIVTQKGSANSHTAILARTMNIPSLVTTDIEIDQEYHGRQAVVDGFAGLIYIDPDEETMAKMVEMGYDYVTVDANTWNGQTEEIKTVGSQQVILVPTSLDYAVAYHMAKAVCENKADLASAVAAMSYFDPQTAGTLTLTGVPLHPGAAAYYEEMGYAHG